MFLFLFSFPLSKNVSAGITSIGVTAYQDRNLTQPCTTIDWGMVAPHSQKNVTIFIRNDGTVPVTLTLQANDWHPKLAPKFLTLAWSYDGSLITAGHIIEVTLTLNVDADVEKLKEFSFSIQIVAVA